MNAAEWLAASSAGVAVLAAGFSWRQVRHANGQVLAVQMPRSHHLPKPPPD
ncbi:hypothetical protein ACWDX6_20710 [Streptomyces sp. NPDC003027]